MKPDFNTMEVKEARKLFLEIRRDFIFYLRAKGMTQRSISYRIGGSSTKAVNQTLGGMEVPQKPSNKKYTQTEIEDLIDYLSYCVKESVMDEDLAMEMISRKDWIGINKLREAGDAAANDNSA